MAAQQVGDRTHAAGCAVGSAMLAWALPLRGLRPSVGNPGPGKLLTSSSQELRLLLRPQLLLVPCEATKLRSRSISSERRACSSCGRRSGQGRRRGGQAGRRPEPMPASRPTWLWRSSSWPSCWQRCSVSSRSSACCVSASISRHFCEYCSDSTCSSRFSASSSDLSHNQGAVGAHAPPRPWVLPTGLPWAGVGHEQGQPLRAVDASSQPSGLSKGPKAHLVQTVLGQERHLLARQDTAAQL